LKKYAERVAYFQNAYELQIDLKQTELAQLDAERQTSEWHVKDLQKRIDELRSEIESIRKSISSLIKKRDKLLSGGTSESNTTSAVLYTTTMQQNIALENSYRLEINDYISRLKDEKLRLEEVDISAGGLLEEIENLKLAKNNIQNIQILRPPSRSAYPIKPKIKINAMLATALGLFVMLLLAFLLEYFQKNQIRQQS
jgi:uncharacterized protein involved in exopolysaccharide biosynthesis